MSEPVRVGDVAKELLLSGHNPRLCATENRLRQETEEYDRNVGELNMEFSRRRSHMDRVFISRIKAIQEDNTVFLSESFDYEHVPNEPPF